MTSCRLTWIAPLLLLAGGCASITASNADLLTVIADIPGSDVTVNGVVVGRTPTNLEIDRRNPPLVEVHARGRSTQRCPLTYSAGGGYVAADVVLCVLLFPLGCISFIDAGGAWNQLSDSQCYVNFGAAYPPPPPPPPQHAPPASPPPAS